MIAPRAPDGFVLVPGTERATATAIVFDVRSTESDGPPCVCKRMRSRAMPDWVASRLAAEGTLLRQLGGHRTPRLVAMGSDAQGPWLVMDRAPGQALAASLGVATPDWMLRAFRGAFEALAHVHAAGIVHADVNADNVFVAGRTDQATLLDFGLSIWPGAPAMPAGPFRGSIAYAAPEVARGEPFDGRADLFALAATCLHVACGRIPRQADTAAAALLAAGDVDLRPWAADAARGWPEPIAEILVRCCAFDAKDRPATAVEVCAVFGDPSAGA